MSNLLKIIQIIILWAIIIPSYAIDCIVTAVKDSCWLNYDVTIDIIDVATHKQITSVTIPKNDNWTRMKFSCHLQQSFLYQAHFQPIIWKHDVNKLHQSRHYWVLPNKMNANEIAWEMKVCYAHDFSATPIPPDSRGHCVCDFSKIPPL